MFKKPQKHIGNNVDKIVKGIIIGGAIGSVVGVTLAPQAKKVIAARNEKQKTPPAPSSKKKEKPFLTSFAKGITILLTGKK